MSKAARARTRLRPSHLLVLLLFEALAATMIGPTALPPGTVLHALAHPFGSSTTDAIVWLVRLPRVVAACLIGASLAVAGLIMQTLLRNPLADPYLIGTSSGASLGATIAEIAVPSAAAVPAGAFVGASLAAMTAALAARGRAASSSVTVVLVGYALSVILGAVTSLLMTFHRTSLMTIFFWQLGGLGSVSWTQDLELFAVLALGVMVTLYYRRELDALAFEGDMAAHLGVDVGNTRLVLLLLAGLITAVTVSAAGLIGFVGLVAPHVARRLSDVAHDRALLAATAGGSAFLLLCDTIARSLPIGEIPVGIVTAILGGPFFIWLLMRGWKWGRVTT